MKRLHLLEIEDQAWCPRVVRDGITDYLQFVISTTKPYEPVVPVLASALERTDQRQVLDLCSGAAGPWLWLQRCLAERGLQVSVCLTDKYPNAEAFQQLDRHANKTISYCAQPIDATQVPIDFKGFRTMFTAFHHFRAEQARAILADAARKRQGIAIFEFTQRSLLTLVLMLLVPFMFLLMTPLIRPFRWSRLLWTYLIPLIPMIATFDGMISCLRTYSRDELREMTNGIAARDYQWEVGLLRKKWAPVPITYLIGLPTETSRANHSAEIFISK
jgi:hypothetical protein